MYDLSGPLRDVAVAPTPGRSRVDGRTSGAPGALLRLQRLAGNTAVRGLLERRAPPVPTVQRCGGVVHEGCSCANEEAPSVASGGSSEQAQQRQQADDNQHRENSDRTRQRDTDKPDQTEHPDMPDRAEQTDKPGQTEQTELDAQGEQPIQRFVDGTADAPSTDLPDGSPYASMDADLLAMLGRTLTAKSFWRWSGGKPTNLGAALDLLGPADINTLVQLKKRCDLHGLWKSITTMTGLWSTSSLGITFTGPGGLQGTVDGAEQFCRDTAVGESYHPGKSCWREIVPPDTPGLHVCLPNEIHIDPHQTVDGKGWAWSWGSGGPEFGTACTYSFLAFLSHMGDVEGNRPVNPFTHHGQIRGKIDELLPQLQERVKSHPDIGTNRDDIVALSAEMEALSPILRRWSIQGKEGGDGDEEARRVLNQLEAADGRLSRAKDALRGSEDVPDPSLLYGP